MQRTSVFIDGPNLYATAKALGFDVDFKKLKGWASMESEPDSMTRMHYYTTIAEDGDGFASIIKLTDWLSFNGYSVVTKDMKEFTQSNGDKKFKGSTDIELAVDALVESPRLDYAVIVSGNENFAPLIHELKARGVFVTVVSSIQTKPPMCANELRRAADHFIDLTELRQAIEKERVAR